MDISLLVTGPLSVNAYFLPIDGSRCVVVDPGGNHELIIAHLSERRLSPAAIVLTHGHFDHLIALPDLVRAFPGIPVAIHAEDSAFLGPGAFERHRSFFAALGGQDLVDSYRLVMPPATSFLSEGDDLSVALGSTSGKVIELGWKVIHSPGHSPGSICLYSARSGVLVSGDTLFNEGFGRTDAPGGDISALERSLTRLSKLPAETIVLPGHGPSTTIRAELSRA